MAAKYHTRRWKKCAYWRGRGARVWRSTKGAGRPRKLTRTQGARSLSGSMANILINKARHGLPSPPPVVSVPGQRQSISAVLAVNSKGGFWFSTYQGSLNGDRFVDLLRQMMKSRRKPLHQAKTLKSFSKHQSVSYIYDL